MCRRPEPARTIMLPKPPPTPVVSATLSEPLLASAPETVQRAARDRRIAGVRVGIAENEQAAAHLGEATGTGKLRGKRDAIAGGVQRRPAAAQRHRHARRQRPGGLQGSAVEVEAPPARCPD